MCKTRQTKKYLNLWRGTVPPLLCRPARLQITQTFLYPHMHFPFSSFLPDYFDGNMDFAQFLFFFLLSFTSKPKAVYFFSLNSSLFQLELLSSRSPPVFSNWSCCLLLHLQPLPTEAVVCFAAGRIISAIMMEKFMAHEILAGRSCPHFRTHSICNSVV